MTEPESAPAVYRPASWLDGPCAWLAWVLPLSLGVWSANGGPRWQDDLFLSLARRATNASDFFNIPAGRVVELGTLVTI